MKAATFLKASAPKLIASGVLVLGLASISSALWIMHRQSAWIKPVHVAVARSLGGLVVHVHEQRPLVFRIDGQVHVGLPNRIGVLAVVFSGRGLAPSRQSALHLFARGTPEPNGTLALDGSRFSLALGRGDTILGRATSFESTAIGVVAHSSTGVRYRGVLSTEVNAVTHRFTSILTLRPVPAPSVAL